MRKKAALHNLGCKVNAYELEAMQELLEKAGYEIVPFAPGADVYVINTCTVTNIADRKSRQMLHKARKMNPDAIVAAAGCYVQTGEDLLRSDPAVDILIGNDKKGEIVNILAEFEALREGSLETTSSLRKTDKSREHEALSHMKRIDESREYEPLSISSTADRCRAFIKITDGCNQFCSYCLIPYARGRVRSRRPDDILNEIRALSEKGYQEIVLTGIHISSYGTDFLSCEACDLLSLVRRISDIAGIRRIRLGSLEPGIITGEFVRALAKLPQLCPHFHLSLQSGCDKTLHRMNRQYTSGQYREKCDLLREYFRDPALTTDIIAGFPGETEEDFEQSRAFAEEMRFYETHIFKYSRRSGTRADLMPDQVPEEVKERRCRILLDMNRRSIRRYETDMYGKTLEVLLEERIKVGNAFYMTGHSREYIPVAVPKGEGTVPGRILQIPVTGHLEEHLLY